MHFSLLEIFNLYFSFIAWISKYQRWKIQQALSSVVPPACVLQEYLFYSFHLGIFMKKNNYHTATHSLLWLSCIFRGLKITLILLVFVLYKMPSSFSKNLSECNTGENRQSEPGKGTQERLVVVSVSVTAVIPASSRQRKIHFKNCFLASLLFQSTRRRYSDKNINEQFHLVIICAPTTD